MDKNWNEEYKQGAHWEVDASSHAKEFVRSFSKGQTILDAGCGSGRDSFYFASKGLNVSGIDISEVAIQKAQKDAKQQHLDIDFRVGNVEELPYKEGEFDGIFSGYTLQRTDLNKVSDEFNRVLKSGGLVGITMFELIKYKDHDTYDLEIPHQQIIDVFSTNFEIVEDKVDEYEEEDQHGEHKHRRLYLLLEK